ncbi:protein SOSEKI 5-like [Silene latifolia]|uniref:protein SOSEKI 5-like n=1 Tax=Silene latifolia TaxID=37657 RepID=UPI003D7807DC
MAVSLSKTRSEQLQLHKNRNEQDEDMDNNNNNNNGKVMEQQKRALVPVVYYLSRNGQLEHPHFMEVPLSSPQGLYLRDIIHRLNLLRGKSMASHYSWSSKRSYKSGYVWHDLGENDYIHPVHGGEYVLKGSEILETTSLLLSSPSLSKSPETSSSSSGKTSNAVPPAVNNRRRNQSWGAIDLHEYKVYKSESTQEFAAADASTQTDDKRRRRKAVIKEEPEIEMEEKSMELSRGEISPPPPSDSSPETLEALMKADGRLIINNNNNNGNAVSSTSQAIDQVAGAVDQTAGYCPNGGKMKASSVLMSLISCGSISFRDCGATAVKDHGLSLISHYKPRSTRGGNTTTGDDNGDGINNDNDDIMKMKNNYVGGSFAKMALEDKEYFSGSLIETNKNNYKEDPQFISLKRSSSYNADRSSHLKLDRKEVDGVRAKCIPRRPKAQPNNTKERVSEASSISITSTQNGSQN